MAFIVENGTIVAGATSYATVAEFDAYWTDRNVTLSSTTAQKEAALIIATQYADNNYTFVGYLVNSETQPLNWPRSFAIDNQGRNIDPDEIPDALKNGVYELAYREINNSDGIQPDVSDTGELISKESNLGGGLISKKQWNPGTGGYFGRRSYPQADKWLSRLTNGGSSGNFGKMCR